MSQYPPPKRNFIAVKVILAALGAILIFTAIVPTSLSSPCTWPRSLSSSSHGISKLKPWSFRGVGSSRKGVVEGQNSDNDKDDGDDGKKQKVQLEIHIMSKCPDAKDCMEQLVFPALEELGPDIVDFRMSFIGKLGRDGGVSCMHGPDECLGNMIHLCGAKQYPYSRAAEKQNTTFIAFSQCLIHDYQNIPDQSFIEDCAKEGKVDFGKINECVSDQGFEGGVELLRSSFEWSEHLGVRASCTVRLAGKSRCVRDGGVWRDCEGGSSVEDLVRDVKEEYYGKKGDVVEEFDEEGEEEEEGYEATDEEVWREWLKYQG